MKVVMKI